MIKLPQTPDITGLFQSLTPYFDSPAAPAEKLMQLKLQEGVYSLLNVAYDKIMNEKKKLTDVCLEVGFKNLSHFSSAFEGTVRAFSDKYNLTTFEFLAFFSKTILLYTDRKPGK